MNKPVEFLWHYSP